jgi:hypothetical protein
MEGEDGEAYEQWAADVLALMQLTEPPSIEWYGARFQAEICTRGCHWIPRMFP